VNNIFNYKKSHITVRTVFLFQKIWMRNVIPARQIAKESVSYAAFRLFLKHHAALFFAWSGHGLTTPRNVLAGTKAISRLITEILDDLTAQSERVIKPKKKGAGATSSAQQQLVSEPVQQFERVQEWIR
jgi:hypothetical protein